MSGSARVALVLVALAALPAHGDAPAPPPASPVVEALNQLLRWYRQQAAVAQLATDPADLVFVDEIRRQSRHVARLAFEYARAAAALEPAQAAPPPGAGGPLVSDPRAIAALADQAASKADDGQRRIAALQQQRSATPGPRRAVLDRQLAEARGQVALSQALRDTLRSFAGFIAQEGSGGARGLLGQIAELERSIPEASAADPAPAAPASPPETLRRATPGGTLALATELLSVGRKMHAVDEGEALTTELRDEFEKLRLPLGADVRETIARADALSREPATTDPATLDARARRIAELTDHFKQVSAALVPLGQVDVLLRAHGSTIAEWRSALDSRYGADLRALGLRVGLLAIAIAAVLTASAFWRAATFRYVHDVRRRHQSLVVRRVVVGVTILLMIGFSFVNELGSLATFAGFITAGLAVALQTVILSLAAYFFLIGKYGVRVGDRVQISGVTGDVIEIGLVRLHLLELRPDGQPTGRVVVFSNAVLFQPSANFFKQIPGSSFAWHEITLTVTPDPEYHRTEERLLAAVDEVYREYEPIIAQQHQRMSKDLSVHVDRPRPQSQVRLTEKGLEMTIRFPVPLERASEIDDRMTRALVEAVGQEPRLNVVGSGGGALTPAPAGA